MELFRMCVHIVDVGVRADGGEEALAVFGEDQVAGPVTAATEASAAGKFGERLHGAAGDKIAVAVIEADDFVGVADVDELRIGAAGIEGDAEGLVKAGGEDGGFFGLAVGADAAEDLDFAGLAFGEEDVAVGSGAEEARVVEAGGIELHLKAFGRDRPGVVGTRNDVGAVVDGLLGRGVLVGRVSECGLSGEDGLLCGGGEGENGGDDKEAGDAVIHGTSGKDSGQ